MDPKTPTYIEKHVDAMETLTHTWLNTNTAAAMLGVQVRTLYRLIDDGALPGYRIGRVIRIREQDVEAFINTSRIHPGELAHRQPSVDDGSNWPMRPE